MIAHYYPEESETDENNNEHIFNTIDTENSENET